MLLLWVRALRGLSFPFRSTRETQAQALPFLLAPKRHLGSRLGLFQLPWEFQQQMVGPMKSFCFRGKAKGGGHRGG